MCGEPAVYRINSGAVNKGTGNCEGHFSANSAPDVTLKTGDQIDIHMEYPSYYSAPSSPAPSVLDLSEQSDNGATSTFVAKRSGKAVISVRGPCIEDPNNANGKCLVLQVTVS